MMDFKEFKAKLNYNPGSDEFDLYLWIKDGLASTRTQIQLIFNVTDGIIEPSIKGDNFPVNQLLQSILDEAWKNGMRPTGFKDVLNETGAIKYHLEDMRKLVFK